MSGYDLFSSRVARAFVVVLLMIFGASVASTNAVGKRAPKVKDGRYTNYPKESNLNNVRQSWVIVEFLKGRVSYVAYHGGYKNKGKSCSLSAEAEYPLGSGRFSTGFDFPPNKSSHVFRVTKRVNKRIKKRATVNIKGRLSTDKDGTKIIKASVTPLFHKKKAGKVIVKSRFGKCKSSATLKLRWSDFQPF